MGDLYHNSFKRVCFPGAIYYIVIKTKNNYSYFREPIFCDLFIENLKICKVLKGFKLYAFSVIYDHVNLMIEPSNEFNISQVVKSLKRNIARNINIVMGYTNGYHSQPVGHTILCGLRGMGSAFKYMILGLPILNYDELYIWKFDVQHYIELFNQKFKNGTPYPKFKWQRKFYDHYIRFHSNHLRREKDWDYHYDYTVYNHLKHGLPENWQYTSLNYPELIDYLDF